MSETVIFCEISKASCQNGDPRNREPKSEIAIDELYNDAVHRSQLPELAGHM